MGPPVTVGGGLKLRILGCHGGSVGPFRSSAYLLDDRFLVDVGSGVLALTIPEARALEACVITHSHLDHIGFLPALCDLREDGPTLRVFGIPETLAAIHDHLFNGTIWPDLTRLPPDRPRLALHPVATDSPFTLGRLTFRAIPVSHTVPAVGYLVDDGGRPIVFSGDTGPTERLWRAATDANAALVLVDVALPDRMTGVARHRGHLTPALLRDVLTQLPSDAKVRLIHLKPGHLDELLHDLEPILASDPRVAIAEQDGVYDV